MSYDTRLLRGPGGPFDNEDHDEDHEYQCPHCDFEGTQAQIVEHVGTDHVPRNLGYPRYGR